MVAMDAAGAAYTGAHGKVGTLTANMLNWNRGYLWASFACSGGLYWG